MRRWLILLFVPLSGTALSFAQLQVTAFVKVNQCDPTVIRPNSTIDVGAFQVGLSVPQGLCLTNTGTTPITLTNITVTGGDFSASGNVLPAVIQPNSASLFVVGVTFAPTGAGTRTAQISFTDDATGSPQTFTLNGTGFTDFGLNLNLTVSNTQTVNAGQTAEYLMSVTGAASPPGPGFFNGTVNLACSNAPPGTNCTFLPSSINLQNSSEFIAFEVKVSTTAPAASLRTPGSKLWYSFAAFFALALVLSRKRRMGGALMGCLLLALVVSCGGGSSKTTPTPSGTFPFSVNASANGVTHSKTMVLVVK